MPNEVDELLVPLLVSSIKCRVVQLPGVHRKHLGVNLELGGFPILSAVTNVELAFLKLGVTIQTVSQPAQGEFQLLFIRLDLSKLFLYGGNLTLIPVWIETPPKERGHMVTLESVSEQARVQLIDPIFEMEVVQLLHTGIKLNLSIRTVRQVLF